MIGDDRLWQRALGTVLALLCLLVAPATTSGAEPGAPTSKLLQALAYVPPDEGVVSVAFTDWAGLKALHGGAKVTSASPLEARQMILLGIVRSEATRPPLGLDRLATWSAEWGWDTTDLEWQLGLGPSPTLSATTILRFRDDWDAETFQAQLERHGFERREGRGFVTFSPGPEAAYTAGQELERLIYEISMSPGMEHRPRIGVTFSDGGTVILSEGDGRDFARQAMRSDLAAVADTPFGRAAASLGEPLSALIVAGEDVCRTMGERGAMLDEEAARLVQSVGRLRPYEALGIGYQRSVAGAQPLGRYVFAYLRPAHAERDLQGRSTLIDQGVAADGRPYRDVAFTLRGAGASGRDLVLDVASVEDPPQVLFDLLFGGDALFAICSPVIDTASLTRRPTADVPLFVGPATVALSGGRGIYRWEDVHFGADEVDAQVGVAAGQQACLVRLLMRDDTAEEGGLLVDEDVAAATGSTGTRDLRVTVDYATASLRVVSTCREWSLALEPLEDPNLPFTLSERFYPVRGASIEELLPQTYYVQDEWAAYARWNTSWQFWWQESATSCDVTSGSAELTANITYPQWRMPADADPGAVTRWERFMRNLTTHELGHITIALQGADAIDELLDAGFSAPTCEQVERQANRAATRLHEHYNQLNERYDEETDHGVAQGTGLP